MELKGQDCSSVENIFTLAFSLKTVFTNKRPKIYDAIVWVHEQGERSWMPILVSEKTLSCDFLYVFPIMLLL